MTIVNHPYLGACPACGVAEGELHLPDCTVMAEAKAAFELGTYNGPRALTVSGTAEQIRDGIAKIVSPDGWDDEIWGLDTCEAIRERARLKADRILKFLMG